MMKKRSFETEVPCPYTTYKDISDRLHGTICRFEGRPVYVSVDEDEIHLYTLDRKRRIGGVAFDNADKIDVSSIELGYLNHAKQMTGVLEPNRVYYVRRSVRRQWKQGLSGNNICYEDISGGKVSVDLISTPSFANSIESRFPSFEEALSLMGREGEYAISQDVALKTLPVGIVLLYLRGKNLGWIAPNSKVINLEDSSTRWVAQRQLSSFGLQII